MQGKHGQINKTSEVRIMKAAKFWHSKKQICERSIQSQDAALKTGQI